MVNWVLVTGGAGFIGSHLVDRLMDEGFDVVVLDGPKPEVSLREGLAMLLRELEVGRT